MRLWGGFRLTKGCRPGPLAAWPARIKMTFEQRKAPGPDPLLRHWRRPAERWWQCGFKEWSGLKIFEIWAARDPASLGSIPSAAGFVRARRLISMLARRRRCGALALLALRALRAPLAYQLFLLLPTMSSVFGSPGSCARLPPADSLSAGDAHVAARQQRHRIK